MKDRTVWGLERRVAAKLRHAGRARAAAYALLEAGLNMYACDRFPKHTTWPRPRTFNVESTNE